MDLRLLALVALSALLAGCSSGASPDAAAQEVPPPAVDTTTVPGVEEPEPAPVTVVCEIKRTNLGTPTGYGLNIDRLATDIDECPLEALFGDLAWAQAGLVEAVWKTQATQTGTELWVEADDCEPTLPPTPCPLPRKVGASSPLEIDLSADDLRAIEGHAPLVMVAGQGVVVDLVYTLHITLFPGPMPPGYTAVP